MARTGVLARVLRSVGGEDVLDRLAGLSGSDLTSFLLALTRRRARSLSAPDVLRQYRSDRFVSPSPVPFSVLGLAPLAPLGTCSAVGLMDQNNVVSTVRGTEVAADPTNALALEAALLRQSGPDDVRLASLQRVVRAQMFSGGGRFAHFSLFALVSAGRDRGSLAFERQHFAEHVAFLRSACGDVEFRVTVLDPRFEVVRGDLPADPSRETGYYKGLCFKVFRDGVEIGDGGFVDWTARLTGNRKERLLISGVGVDRFATL